MTYIVKVLTPEFKAKLDQYLLEHATAKVEKDGNYNPDRKDWLISWEVLQMRETFNSIWNRPEDFLDIEGIQEYYESVGLWTPEYTEMELKSAEVGWQSRARVEWNGEIKKIDEIDEIFSYRAKKDFSKSE